MKQALQGPKQRFAFRSKSRQLIIAVAALLLTFQTQAQTPPNRSQMQRINTYYSYIGAEFRNALYVPLDTLSQDVGAIAIVNARFWLRLPTGWVDWGLKQENDSTYTFGKDTFTIQGGGGGTVDTTSLSDRINLKLSISDTASMLLPYLRKVDTASLSSRIQLKLNLSDTAAMLGGYTRIQRFLDSCAALRAAIGSGGGGGITQLTGDVTTPSGSGSQPATLANSGVSAGSYTNPSITVDSKGRVTAATNGTIPLPRSNIDLGRMPVMKVYSPAKGVASSTAIANYSHTSVDSTLYYFSRTRAGLGGTEYGGWLVSNPSGDSVKVTAPFWVVAGDSQAEGHRGLDGRLHPNGVVGFQYNYPDSAGQISYHLSQLTNMRWYNQGIGGQTTVQLRVRFYRDVLGKVTANANDGRGTKTLSRAPDGVVLIIGINDVFNSIPVETTMANLEWMARTCQANGVKCVMLNLPGDEISVQDNLLKIAAINRWLASGVMDQYNCTVVDYNSWWNNSTFGNDNVHKGAYIDDDIHPTKVGYDSLSSYIFRSAKLPVLRKAVFINKLSPTNPAGYARPTGITINGVSYSLASDNDTIAINSFVPDSVWVKITSSTPVTNADTTGLSHIEWVYDNNTPTDSLYTRRTVNSNGSGNTSLNVSNLFLQAPTLENSYNLIDAYLGDGTNRAFQMRTGAGGTNFIFNGLGNTATISNAVISIYGSTAIGTAGSILGTASNNQLGNLQLQNNSTPTTTGYGISVGNTTSAFTLHSTGLSGRAGFRFTNWNGATQTLNNTMSSLIQLIGMGFGDATAFNQRGNVVALQPTFNNTSGANIGAEIRGIYYNPIRTSLTNTRHYGAFFVSGNNYFNITRTDSTCFGCDSTEFILAEHRVKGSIRHDIGFDATGDLHYRGSNGLQTRIAIGSNGDVLTNVSGTPTWQAPAGPSITSNQVPYGTGSGITSSSAYSVANDGSGGYTLKVGTGTVSDRGILQLGNTSGSGTNVIDFIGGGLLQATSNIGQMAASGFSHNWYLGSLGSQRMKLDHGGLQVMTRLKVDTVSNMSTPDSFAVFDNGEVKASSIEQVADVIGSTSFTIASVTTTGTSTIATYVQVHTIKLDATGGNITRTLTATKAGQIVNVKRMDNSGNSITIQGSSGNIDGGASITLTTQYQSRQLQWDGSNWILLN